MAGYSARQSSFTTGDTIEAADSNDEFNQILAAFHVSTGHTHDGTTAGDGGPLSTLYSNAISMGTGADTDIVLTFNANTSDGVITWMEDEDYFKFSDDILVNSTEKLQFRDTAIYLYSSADGQLDLVADTEIQIAATTIDINGNVDISGTLTIGSAGISEAELEILDGANVTTTELNIIDGDTTASSTTVADADRVVYNDAGTMKQVAVTDLDTYISATSKTLTNKTLTSPVLNTGVSGTAVADEDDMSSNSATKLATQQSIKAYVDAQITAEDLDVTSDSGTIAIDLDSETLTIAGGTGLDSSATSNTVTLAIDSTVTTLTGSQTLTNKTLTSPVLNTGVSGTAILDEDNLASDSATKLATQQSIKAYVDAISTGTTTFVMEDDDGTEVTISNNKEIKFIGSGLTTNWTDTDNGTDGDPYDLTFTIDAAQTGITSLLATDIKIGEDNETKIDFETANEIHFYANNTEQVYLADNIFGPQSDSDVDLGTTGVRWKDAYVDSLTTTANVSVGGDLTVNGTTTTVNSTTVTIDDPIFTLGGDSAPGSDDNKDRGIEFRWHNGTAAKIGFFGYDDSASVFTFIPDASNSSEVFSGTVGNVAFGNIAGTLTTAAQTNITSVGALDGGSISSGFGAIDTGSSNITTTGLISGGSLDIDDVLINGTTIGHTDDTDLMTLSNGGLVVAGTLEATGNITGTLATAAQTNITSTGALDGGSITSGFGAIDNGTSGIRSNTFTAETSVVPDTAGGADLGSTSAEWGDVYIADDKKIYFGSDQDISMEYDEDGTDTLLVSGDVTIADDKKLYFGSGKDVSIEYDEDGIDTLLIAGGDVTIADDRKLYFGSGKDVSLEYDEDGNDTLSINGDVLIEDDKKLFLGSGKDLSVEYDENGNDTTAIVAAGGVSMAPHGTSTGNGTELRFQELAANGANYVGFKAPDAIAANKVFVLPNADGTAGQFLTTDGSTNLSWGSAATEISLTAKGTIAAGKPVSLITSGTDSGKGVITSTGIGTTLIKGAVGYPDGESTDYIDGSTDNTTSGRTDKMVYGRHTGNVYFVGRRDNREAVITAGTINASTGAITWGTTVVVASSTGIGSLVECKNYSGTTIVVWIGNVSTNAQYAVYTVSGTSLSAAKSLTTIGTSSIGDEAEVGEAIECVGKAADGYGSGASNNYDPIAFTYHIQSSIFDTSYMYHRFAGFTDSSNVNTLAFGATKTLSNGSSNVDDNAHMTGGLTMVWDPDNLLSVVIYSQSFDYGNYRIRQYEITASNFNSTERGSETNLDGTETGYYYADWTYDESINRVIGLVTRDINESTGNGTLGFIIATNDSGNPTVTKKTAANTGISTPDSNDRTQYVQIAYNSQSGTNYSTAFIDHASGASSDKFVMQPITASTTAITGQSYESGTNVEDLVAAGDIADKMANPGDSSSFDDFHPSALVAVPNSNMFVFAWRGPVANNYAPRAMAFGYTTFDYEDQFIGVAQNAVSDGQTVNVKSLGQIDTQQSSLTIGSLVYVDSGTSAITATSTDNTEIGRAVSASSFIVTKLFNS